MYNLCFQDEHSMSLLDDDSSCLEDAGFLDDHSILVEVRSRDGTWPEEISSVFANAAAASAASTGGGLDRRLSTMRSTTQVAHAESRSKSATRIACQWPQNIAWRSAHQCGF